MTALQAGRPAEAVEHVARALEKHQGPVARDAARIGAMLGAMRPGDPIPEEATRYFAMLAMQSGAGPGLRKAREKLGISRQQLADALGCAVVTVQFWENGKVRPPDRAFYALAQLSQDRLFALSPDPDDIVLTGADIRRIRMAAKLSLSKFAALMGIPQITLELWERKAGQPLTSKAVLRIRPALEEAGLLPLAA